MNAISKIVKRELYINRKLSYHYLPFLLVMVLFFAVTGRVVENISRLLILLLSLNLLLPMIYFVSVYLQQLKDKEKQFILSLPFEKQEVIVGKTLYIVIVVMGFNFTVFALSYLISSRTFEFLIFLNSYLLSCFIGIVVGMSFLLFFLLSSFENFNNHQQYLRMAIIFAFISGIYILKPVLSKIENSMFFNPVYATLLYVIVIYLFCKTILFLFQKKKSYL